MKVLRFHGHYLRLVLRWIPQYLSSQQGGVYVLMVIFVFTIHMVSPQNSSLLGYCVHPWGIWLLTSLALTTDDSWSLLAPLCI